MYKRQFYAFVSYQWDTSKNNGNQYFPGKWYRIDNQNARDKHNWILSGTETVLPDALRYRQRKNYRTTGTGSRPNANWAGSYHSKTGEKPYRHKCTVCGRTDTDYPNLEFRYCSKCNGYYCYCIDHINNHVHITTPPEGAGKEK